MNVGDDVFLCDRLGRKWSASVFKIKRITPSGKSIELENNVMIKTSNLDGYDFIGRYQTLDINKFKDKIAKELEGCELELERLQEIQKRIETFEKVELDV